MQIGGFGIGCRGTGNEKARKLKEEHDEKIRRRKAAKKAAVDETRHNPARANHLATDDDELEWRVRNQTVNKKANRKKKKGARVDETDEDEDVTLESTFADLPEEVGDERGDIDGGEAAVSRRSSTRTMTSRTTCSRTSTTFTSSTMMSS